MAFGYSDGNKKSRLLFNFFSFVSGFFYSIRRDDLFLARIYYGFDDFDIFMEGSDIRAEF
jgi:hypothetical protein